MISVCLAAFNGDQFIKEQILSILPQLSGKDELLISDDGSTDRTIEIILNFNDPRIKLFQNNYKCVTKNFEFLIRNASGDIIFLSDQDDIWANDKVIKFLEVFSSNLDISLVLSDLQIINSYGEKINKVFYQNKFKSGLIENVIVNNFIGCSMAFRKDLIKDILPFPNNIAMHDWWIGTCCILVSKIFFINEKLQNYRRHGNNFTEKRNISLLTKIFWRLNLVRCLISRFIKLKYSR